LAHGLRLIVPKTPCFPRERCQTLRFVEQQVTLTTMTSKSSVQFFTADADPPGAASGISYDESMSGNVSGHHTSGSYERMITKRYTAHNRGICTNGYASSHEGR